MSLILYMQNSKKKLTTPVHDTGPVDVKPNEIGTPHPKQNDINNLFNKGVSKESCFSICIDIELKNGSLLSYKKHNINVSVYSQEMSIAANYIFLNAKKYNHE